MLRASKYSGLPRENMGLAAEIASLRARLAATYDLDHAGAAPLAAALAELASLLTPQDVHSLAQNTALDSVSRSHVTHPRSCGSSGRLWFFCSLGDGVDRRGRCPYCSTSCCPSCRSACRSAYRSACRSAYRSACRCACCCAYRCACRTRAAALACERRGVRG